MKKEKKYQFEAEVLHAHCTGTNDCKLTVDANTAPKNSAVIKTYATNSAQCASTHAYAYTRRTARDRYAWLQLQLRAAAQIQSMVNANLCASGVPFVLSQQKGRRNGRDMREYAVIELRL